MLKWKLKLINRLIKSLIRSEIGTDNPFLPGGQLSREAQSIVDLVKQGKPITPEIPIDSPDSSHEVDQQQRLETKSVPQLILRDHGINTEPIFTPLKNRSEFPRIISVRRDFFPKKSQEPERIMIKNKSKLKCCVVQ